MLRHERAWKLSIRQHSVVSGGPEVDQMTHMVLEQEIVGSSTSTFSALAPFGRSAGKFAETLSGFAQAGIQGEIRQVWDRSTHGTRIFRRAVDAD
jgi:hypothetical protein